MANVKKDSVKRRKLTSYIEDTVLSLEDSALLAVILVRQRKSVRLSRILKSLNRQKKKRSGK